MDDDDTPLELRSLAAQSDVGEGRHEVYLEILAQAIEEQPDVRNIAVTGAYGTGKSSVLGRLAQDARFQGRILQLSLSTVVPGSPGQAGTGQEGQGDRARANLIEKEIVKQILYRDSPSKMASSRFRRLSRFRWRREISAALPVALLLLALLWFTGIGWRAVDNAVGARASWAAALAVWALLLAALWGAVLTVRRIAGGRVSFDKIGAGPATISLSEPAATYFDQYTDEIVYYFEQSGRDIVVFEDIDRFDEIGIFESLRALNSLLNGAEQIRRRRDPSRHFRRGKRPRPAVKFIYALRDSVFESLDSGGGDSADDEIRRANRTKFFDLIIPIVPFITHRNARSILSRQMEGTGVSRDLVSLAGRHTADMRVVLDLRNEYDVYARMLLGTPSQVPGLDPDRLFALILYKAFHMADFEDIRLGTSALDDLHRVWRQIVQDSLARVRGRERSATRQLERQGTSDRRARLLGDRLQEVAQGLMPNMDDNDPFYAQIDDRTYPAADTRTPEFWNAIVSSEEGGITLGVPRRSYSAVITSRQLHLLMGDCFNPEEWGPADRVALRQEQAAARGEIRFLRHHTWQQIYDRPEYVAAPAAGSDGRGEPFRDAAERLLGSDLARELVAGGYLDDYFALYVSMHYGEHLRVEALNYIRHALDPGVPDIDWALEPADVEAILKDKQGEDIFSDRAAYNIDILDHLLRTPNRAEQAEAVIRQISAWGPEDTAFADRYLQSGHQQAKFTGLLSPLVPRMPEYLATSSAVSEHSTRMVLVDTALDYEDKDPEVRVGDDLRQFVRENYQDFPSITPRPDGGPALLRKPGTIPALAVRGIRLPNISPLTPAARMEAAQLGTYDTTGANLRDLTGQKSLALDAIRDANETVYRTMLRRLDEYLAVAQTEGAVTVAEPENFAPILEDVAEAAHGDDAWVRGVVSLASPRCAINDLHDAPQAAWAALAAGKRTEPDARNLLAYLDMAQAIDDDAAALLDGVPEIPNPDQEDPGAVTRLALALLNARTPIPSPSRRVDLAASLHPDTPLPIGMITPESGELTGLLIQAGMAPDDVATFTGTLVPDWETKEYALAASSHAAEFISPAILPPDQLGAFFCSNLIPPELKGAVLSQIGAFTVDAPTEGIRAAARYANQSGARLDVAAITRLSDGGAPGDVVQLLARNDALTIDELRGILHCLPDPYPAIADPGRQRPTLPDDDAHNAVLDRLQEAGIVNQHRPERDGRQRVTLKQA